MALFENFPYTNLHDLNLDWVLRTIRELIAEWQSFHKEIEDWRDLTDAQFQDLKDYVMNYFNNLDLHGEVTQLIREMFDDGTIADIVEKKLDITPRTIRGDVLINTYRLDATDAGKWMQAGCYIGNGRLVVYFADNDRSNTGTLICYDVENQSILWEYDLEAYHGNAMCYVAHENNLYIAACYSELNTGTLIPTIFKVSLSDPSTIAGTITPAVSGIYSLTYGDGYFYAMTARGTTPGEANKITVFNENFEVVRQMLVDYAALQGYSTQGICCYAHGVLYNLIYSNRSVEGFDAQTGEKVFAGQFEEYFNRYRYNGEVEFLAYDDDNDEFYLGSTYVNNGISGWRTGTIAKVGLYHDITIRTIYPDGYAMRSSQGGSLCRATAILNRRVQYSTNGANLPTVIDAINLSKNLKVACEVRIAHTSDGTPYDGFTYINMQVRDFEGTIIAINGSYPVPVHGLFMSNCCGLLQNLLFNGQTTWSDFFIGSVTGAALLNNCDMEFANCSQENDVVIHCYHSRIYERINATRLLYRLTQSNFVCTGTTTEAQGHVYFASANNKAEGLYLVPDAMHLVNDTFPMLLHNAVFNQLLQRRGIRMSFNDGTYWQSMVVKTLAATGLDLVGTTEDGSVEIVLRLSSPVNNWTGTITLVSVTRNGNESDRARFMVTI